MNINELLISIQTQSGGVLSEDAIWTDWVNVALGFLFVGLAIWFMWIYFDKKNSWEAAKPRFDKHSSGTFKGFWLRYRGAIVAFMVVVFLILAIGFLLLGFLGIEPNNDFVS